MRSTLRWDAEAAAAARRCCCENEAFLVAVVGSIDIYLAASRVGKYPPLFNATS